VWELLDTGWHVSVDGDAPLEVTLRMPIPLERMADISPAYTANRAVNAVPYVCAAAPGIHSTVDLPQVVTTLRGDARVVRQMAPICLTPTPAQREVTP
jgi:hypothetical protein